MNLFLIFKIFILILIAIYIRGIIPRYRIDQFTQLNWKILIFNLFIYFLFLIFFINILS